MEIDRMVHEVRFQFWRLRDAIRDRVGGRAYRQRVFQLIHDGNLWGDPESLSGGGSGTVATEAICRELPLLFQRYGIGSMLDAPCGDFRWMRNVVSVLDRYAGVDIVPELIARNQIVYGTTTISFACADIASDPLPRADLILCRDCLIHLPTRLIYRAFRNFRASGSRYLLLTNDRDVETYHDIPIGSFRRVNFARAPFLFPDPICILSEAGGGNRQLCLWELDSLPVDRRSENVDTGRREVETPATHA